MGLELKKIDHIALQVDDVNKSVEWYVEKYECEVLYNDDTWALLQFDNIKVALVVEEEHPFHIAFEIDGLDGEGNMLMHTIYVHTGEYRENVIISSDIFSNGK